MALVKISLTLLSLMLATLTYAQWSNSGFNYTTDRIAIGTSAWSGKRLYVTSNDADHVSLFENTNTSGYGLHVRAANDPLRIVPFSGSGNYLFVINGNGNVGINTSTPDSKLQIMNNGGLAATDEIALLNISTPVTQSNTGGKHGIRFSSQDGNGLYTQKVTEILNVSEADWSNQNGLAFHTGGQEQVRIKFNGNVGIGTPSPIEKLDVNGNINIPIGKTIGYAVSAGQSFSYDNNTLGAYSIGWAYDNWADGRGSGGPTGNFSGWGGLKFFTANQPRMSIDNSGRVGIGTTQPDYPLTVNGTVHSKEVKVDLGVPAPDYVFEKDYKLTSLEDIKTYIDQNKHLPEVPSAKEMEQNGIQLGEMNLLLLKKIEELTLYVIEQNKKTELQDTQNKMLKEMIEVQQKQIDELNKKLVKN